MRKIYVSALLAAFVFGGIAVLGNSPEFINKLLQAVQDGSGTSLFSSPASLAANETQQPLPNGKERFVESEAAPTKESTIPDYILYGFVFRIANRLSEQTEIQMLQGERAVEFRSHFLRETGLTPSDSELLTQSSDSYSQDLLIIDAQAQAIADRLIRQYLVDSVPENQQIPPTAELLRLQGQRNELALLYKEQLKVLLGDEKFFEFDRFINGEFARGFRALTPSSVRSNSVESPQGCQNPNYCIYITHYVNLEYPYQRVYGFTRAEITYLAGLDYIPRIDGRLYRTDDPETNLDFDSRTGNGNAAPIAVNLYSYNFVVGKTYCHQTNVFGIRRSNNNLEFIEPWEDCKTVVSQPTPTPTPPCDPSNIEQPPPSEILEPCIPPTPTPLPSPSPTVSIEVKTVGFDGDFEVLKFSTLNPATGVALPITDPTWTRGSSANTANVVAYKKGTETDKVKLSASFDIQRPAGQNQSLSVKMRVKNNNGVIATAQNSTSVTGNSFSISNLALSSVLESPALVKKGSYNFVWEASIDDGQSWVPAGTSEHIIYWTYGDVTIEPQACANDSEKRNCLFVNSQGQRDWRGLFDEALKKAIDGLTLEDQTPDPPGIPNPSLTAEHKIARVLAVKIDDAIDYNPGNGTGDTGHPLSAYNISDGVQCSVNANLLRGLLRSIGINNTETVYIWGGKPDNKDKLENETGGMTYGYRLLTYYPGGGVPGESHKSFQAIRPESNEGSNRLLKDPHFTFHAMVKVFDSPNEGTNNLNAKLYDPSYAKRLKANSSRYPDYPYTNSDLRYRLSANLDNPTSRNDPWVHDDATKPYVVRALSLANFCLPPRTPPCSSNTRISRRTRGTAVAAIPRTSVYDGNGVATFSVWRPSDGVWYTRNAYDNIYSYGLFGMSGDIPMPGDYDGDGISDYAVFRPNNSTIYIFESDSQTTRTFVRDSSTDKPVYGDFDGDGLSDVAFYRPNTQGSEWFINRSSDGMTFSTVFGTSAEVPVSGDFDGDGKTDVAVVHKSQGWWSWRDANGNTHGQEFFGDPNEIPVPGDYDGDGKTDYSVYNPNGNYWTGLLSGSQGTFYTIIGVFGDVPVPGDYDGDGKSDLAVWSPSNGHWRAISSIDGLPIEDYWGSQNFGDVPVAAAYLY
jgi:FG-GAP-like repeat